MHLSLRNIQITDPNKIFFPVTILVFSSNLRIFVGRYSPSPALNRTFHGPASEPELDPERRERPERSRVLTAIR